MRIYKRGDIWWAAWTSRGETVRKSTKARSKEIAVAITRRWERELADPGHRVEEKTTFVAAAEQFMTVARSEGLSVGTVNMYDCKLRNLVEFFGADGRLSGITHESVVRYVAHRRRGTADSRGVTDYTIHRELTALRRVLNNAVRAGTFKRIPREVLPKHKPGYEPRTHYLTREQLADLMAHLEPNRAAQVAFVVATSARRSEVASALRSNRKGETMRLRGTKTKASERVVPVASLFTDLFSFALTNADGKGDKLFTAWDSMRRDVAAAAKRAGTPAATWNDLRRTCATWLVQEGVAPSLVAKVLGHTTSAMVERVYGQQTTESVALLIERSIVRPAYQGERNNTKERK